MSQEIEAKFYVSDLAVLENRLQQAGARCLHARTHEINLRFDTQGGDLRRQGRVLRLRRDQHAWLTYKAGRQIEDGLHRREEIEFQVSDFEAARHFLEALGYEVQFIYEKYRTVYLLDAAEIMLDELPYGNFVEIEGPPETVRQLAARLRLAWETAIPLSYHALFERLRQRMHLSFRDLLFENFREISISPEALGVIDALRS